MICRNRSPRITTLITIPEEAPVGFRDATISNNNTITCHDESSKRNWLLEQVSFFWFRAYLEAAWRSLSLFCLIQTLNILPFIFFLFLLLKELESHHRLVNRSRELRNIQPLQRNSHLDSLAFAHAQHMAEDESVYHSVHSVDALRRKLHCAQV